jgi:hypothetical protein
MTQPPDEGIGPGNGHVGALARANPRGNIPPAGAATVATRDSMEPLPGGACPAAGP